MTLVNETGTFNFRPHPGYDINGWGSSWYAQPFLPGAILNYTITDSVVNDTQGIHVYAIGNVSYGSSSTYGIWNTILDFSYNYIDKIITGSGVYYVSLDAPLDDNTGDLNLYKIASNYLNNVPLLCSTINENTGDMQQANIDGTGSSYPIIWIPTDGDTFPYDITDSLSVDLTEEYNNVDTYAQGYGYYIEPAFKPSLKIVLTSQQSNIDMICGLMYDENSDTLFYEDNVGITPLILKQSGLTQFDFDIEFESKVNVPQVNIPVFDPAVNTFFDSLYIKLFTDTPEADIYYTADGSEPTICSTLYSDSIFIDTTTTIKAKAYKCGLEVSEVVTSTYNLEYLEIEDLLNDEINIYPNPTDGLITIEINNSVLQDILIEITSINGQVVYKEI